MAKILLRKQKKNALLALAALFMMHAALSFASCGSGKADARNKSDEAFFAGLQAADEDEITKAITLLVQARDSKDTTPIIAKRSAETLVLLGNITQKNQAAQILAERFGDEQKLIAARELFRQEEFATILLLTDSISIKDAPNELVKIRLDSMLEKNDSRFDKEYFDWIVSRPMTAEHMQYYSKYIARKMDEFKEKQQEALEKFVVEFKQKIAEQNDGSEMDKSTIPETVGGLEIGKIDFSVTDEQMLIDLRANVFRKKYKEAYASAHGIIEMYERRRIDEHGLDADFTKFHLEIEEQVLSDIGKAALYGADNFGEAATILDSLALNLSEEKSFYAHFYAARIYEKTKKWKKAEDRYLAAMESAADEQKFDNALWYMLSSKMKNSKGEFMKSLGKFGKHIKNPEYFDDIFESLALTLLSDGDYQDFYDVWKNSGAHFSDGEAARFAYISGRLLEEKLAHDDSATADDAYRAVLEKNGDMYYKVCAIERLNITDEEELSRILLRPSPAGTESEPAGKADALLDGYAEFGFPQRVYAEWLLNRDSLSVKSSMNASRFLFNCGLHAPEYDTQSLRIASRTVAALDGGFTKEMMELVYPRFFSGEIAEACAENKIEQRLLFALVRTESFFDSSITSVAGATGLTQLMESTAGDEARKLKLGDDYDILDPKTNLRMGAHYLASLISRVDGNIPVLALFAYNGGLTNVRKWIKSSKKSWAKLKKLSHEPAGISMDLFLETVPFSETRGYGRKLVAAAAMYGWIYEGRNPGDTVREILYAQ